MYRFRTIASILDKHNELEKQEIYFSNPDELNDPMEGYKDVFWKGDKIVWKNFIINYVKSTEHIFGLVLLLNSKTKITDAEIRVLSHAPSYRSPHYIALIREIIDKLFEIVFIKELPDHLAKRTKPVRRYELISYTEMIHPFVINSISEIYFKWKMITKCRKFICRG